MLVKSMATKDHQQQLVEMEILKKYKKLNLLKCAFGVSSGKFLGYMVNKKGIEANLEKIQAVIEMRASTSPKEVQSLTGRIVALSHLVSKSTRPKETCLFLLFHSRD